ncbi:hypothetical protein ARMSODRAFT_976405 [Armillaria solidipes]|uniref:Uncharacterized protein n=1 Tax=Armillaria solidipes TaxID=1076256 RepID=A0A2H3BUA3_9AGAR|nr:hypothetical protein ARMSODRAFT_976405 [Armillaria solidipes]
MSGMYLLGRRLPTTLTGDDALLPSNRYCSGRIPIISKSAFYIRRITNGSGFYRPFYDRVRVKSELASYELVDAIRGIPQLMSPRIIYRGMVNNDLSIPTYAIAGGAFYHRSEWYMYTLHRLGRPMRELRHQEEYAKELRVPSMRIERLELSAEHDVSVRLPWVEWMAIFSKHNTHLSKPLIRKSNILKKGGKVSVNVRRLGMTFNRSDGIRYKYGYRGDVHKHRSDITRKICIWVFAHPGANTDRHKVVEQSSLGLVSSRTYQRTIAAESTALQENIQPFVVDQAAQLWFVYWRYEQDMLHSLFSVAKLFRSEYKIRTLQHTTKHNETVNAGNAARLGKEESNPE